MSKVSKMTLKDILDQIDLIMRENDIIYFCDDIKVIQEYMQKFRHQSQKIEETKQFFMQHSDSIDKEKLILLVAKNYQDNLEIIKQRMNLLKGMLKKEEAEIQEFSNLYRQTEIQTASLIKVLKLGRGIETILTFYYYDENEKRNKVDVADSREVIDGKRINRAKSLRRFDEVDLYFRSGGNEELGIEYILQSILLTDLYRVFPTEAFGNDIRTMILENAVIKRGVKTASELQALKTLETYEEYAELIDNISFEGLLPDIKEVLREYCTYIDIDKLLLISAYRFQEGLENGYIPLKAQIGAKEILRGILDNLPHNAKLDCELQDKKDGSYEMQPVQYSIQDIQKCIGRFNKTRYITSQEIEEYRRQVQSQEINLSEMETGCVDVVFSTQELEELSKLNEANFIYVSEKCDWKSEKIKEQLQQRGECSTSLLQILLNAGRLEIEQAITLYESSIVSLESLVSMKEKLVSSEETVFQKMDEYYRKLQQEPDNEEIKNSYNKYIHLYQEIFAKGTPEEKENNSNQLMERMVENYEDEEYVQAIKEYYRNGLLTLNTIAEWNNEDLITDLYQANLITLQDIQALVKSQKISVEYLNNIYASFIYRDDIDYNERLRYIQTGFVKKEDIIDLYHRNLLFETDLQALASRGLISSKEVQRIIDNRTKQDLEKNASIRLTGLNTLTKRNNEIYSTEDYASSGMPRTKPTCIIDPNIREEFIYMLGACRADTDLEESSPFYHYEFYVIPDESGEIGLNSVVIAERYFEDKVTEERFATQNATYFFKYKDLMVLGNLKKSEMTKEREGIVFTASHTIANEKRKGYWASSVMNSLAKTMLSCSLEEYSKQNQKIIIRQKLKTIYPEDELRDILEKAIEIDSGEHICEIIEPEGTLPKRKVNRQPSGNHEGR